MKNIQIMKKAEDAIIPKYQHPGEDAGLDLHAYEACTLAPGTFAMIGTGIAIALPRGYVGYVNPRSGLALRHGVTILNADGVIDCGYRGEIGVILINHGQAPFVVNKGDRIAQLIIHRFEEIVWQEVDSLPDSKRDTGGFGATGRANT